MTSLRARALASAPWLAFALAASSAALVGCGGKTQDFAAADTGATAETGDDVDASPLDAAIDTNFDAPPPPTGQRLLFEAGYENYAWGFTYSGVYVNADGEVWSYELPQSTTPTPSPAPDVWPHADMTEAEITAKYASNPKLVTRLSKESVLAMYKLVSLAETGALVRQSSCADAGSRMYVAWRYDAATAKYSPVQLGMSGDTTARNTVPAAGQLVDWLASVGSLPNDFCTPGPAIACAGSACKPTTCAHAWETPACDGTCVSPIRCETVSGCGVCGDGAACLIDAAGGAHCSQAQGCSSGASSCDCGGDSICAGGKAWCRGTSATGFRCERP
jgi:hypothetical protein